MDKGSIIKCIGLTAVLLLCLSVQPILGQRSTVDAVFKDAVLHEANNSIEVIYDIIERGPSRPFYLVELFYSNDGGINFSGPLNRVTGDVGDRVTPGTDKRISWNYYFEDDNFTGENLVFLVKVRPAPTTIAKVLMGPEAAIYSVAIPGLGDTKVRQGKNYWIITAVTWGTLGAALITRSAAQENYDKYLAANTAAEANAAYDKADRQFSTYSLLRDAAIILWSADVVGVLIRGSRNKKEGLTAQHLSIGVDWARLPNMTMPTASFAYKF